MICGRNSGDNWFRDHIIRDNRLFFYLVVTADRIARTKARDLETDWVFEDTSD